MLQLLLLRSSTAFVGLVEYLLKVCTTYLIGFLVAVAVGCKSSLKKNHATKKQSQKKYYEVPIRLRANFCVKKHTVKNCSQNLVPFLGV